VFHAAFGMETPRDRARERLAPLLSELWLTNGHACRRSVDRFALRVRPRRSRLVREACG
jgi:hypothetical protein